MQELATVKVVGTVTGVKCLHFLVSSHAELSCKYGYVRLNNNGEKTDTLSKFQVVVEG